MPTVTKKIIIFFIFSFLLFSCWPAQAAKLYFKTNKTKYKTGEIGTVTLYVNSEKKITNAIAATMSFDPNLIDITKVISDKAIINYWAQSPMIDKAKGKVIFQGVVFNPAYKGTAGRIVSFNFKAKAPGSFHFHITGFTVLANDGKGSNLATKGVASYVTITGKPLEEPKIKLASPTHPDQTKWYKKNDVSITWQRGKEVVVAAYAFNKETNFQVPESYVTDFSSAIEKGVANGTWYAHIRAKDKKLGWLPTNHFKINIDTEPPSSNTVTVLARANEAVLPSIRAVAKDSLSGIDYYEVWVGGKMLLRNKTVNNYKLKNLAIGRNVIEVKAFDRAGNILISKVSAFYNPLRVPAPSPKPTTPTKPSTNQPILFD